MKLHFPVHKGSMPTLVAMALLVFALQAAPVVAGQSPPSANQLLSLEPAATREGLQAGATAFLSSLLSKPANQEVRLADANPALISADTRELVIPISDNARVTFQQRSFEITESVVQDMQGIEVKNVMQVWYGDVASDRKQRFNSPEEVDIDPFNNAMIVRDGEKLVGGLRVAGQSYRLDALENGKHAFIRVDESKLLSEGEPLIASDEEQQDQAISLPEPETSHSTIGVMVLTTKQSRAARPNYPADIQWMISHANQVNRDSGIAITYELRAVLDYRYDEGDKTSEEMLAELSSGKGDLGGSLIPYRVLHRADLVSMIINRYQYCGQAYLNSTRARAFSLVVCNGSFAHELGHNMGANHARDPGSPVTNPPYNNAYQHKADPRFRTIMAGECPTGGSCPRINFFSTPLKRYLDIPMGTDSTNNNVRRLNERREYVDAFYP